MKKICKLVIFMALLAAMTTTVFAEEVESAEPMESPVLAESAEPAAETAIAENAVPAADVAKQYLQESFAVMQDVKSGSYNVNLEGVSSGMKFNGIMAFKGETRPEIAVGGTMTTVMTSLVGRETRQAHPFYLVQEGNDLVNYMQNDKGIWEKSITKDFTKMMKSPAAETSQETLSELMAAVSNVQLLQDSAANRQIQVTIDMQKLGAAADKQMENAKMKKEDRENVQKYLSEMGNVDVVFNMDPSTKYVTSMTSDLTDPCRRLAGKILAGSKSVSDVQRELVQRIIDGSTLKMSVTEGGFNAVQPAVVPAEVKDKAVVVKLENKAAAKKGKAEENN